MTETRAVVRGDEADPWDALPRLAAELDAADGVEDVVRRVVRCALASLLCDSASVVLEETPRRVAAGEPDEGAGEDAADRAGEATGAGRALALPLVAGGERFGVLELVSRGRLDARLVRAFARMAALALRHRREEEGLRRAVEGRTVIGQAQGILMERHGLDAQRAFQVLARYSQDGNVKLVEVARDMVATRRLPE